MTSSGFDRNYIRFKEGEEIVYCTDEDAYDELSIKSKKNTHKLSADDYHSLDSYTKSSGGGHKEVVRIDHKEHDDDHDSIEATDTVSMLSSGGQLINNDEKNDNFNIKNGENNNFNKFNHKPKPKPNIPLSPHKVKTKHGHLDLAVVNESVLDENGESIFSTPPIISKTEKDLHVLAEPVFPVMKINNAVYGHLTDQKKQIDVTSNIETLVEKQVNDVFFFLFFFRDNNCLLVMFLYKGS